MLLRLPDRGQGPLRVVVADVAPVRLDPPEGAGQPLRGTCGGGGGSAGCGTRGCSSGGDDGGGAATGCAAGGGGGCCHRSGNQEPVACASSDQGCGTAIGSKVDAGQACSSSNNGGGRGEAYRPPPLGGLVWRPPGGAGGGGGNGAMDADSPPPRCIIWLGPSSGPALTHLQLTHSAAPWVCLDPAAGYSRAHGLCESLDRLLRRRYFLVEKARGAQIIGLLVGTLGAAGYLQALEALRALAQEVGRRGGGGGKGRTAFA
jgi:hypothetical protein